jgi:hypothetical protein
MRITPIDGRGCHGFRTRHPCIGRGLRHGLRTTRGTRKPTDFVMAVDSERFSRQ